MQERALGPYGDWVPHAVAEGGLYPPVDRPGLIGDEVRALIGSPGNGEPLAAEPYVGEFYDGPHKFDRAMQASAFAHLDRWLRVPTT